VPVRTGGNQSGPARSSELNELAGHDVNCREFIYQRGSKIFGEAEPVENFYQVKSGAVRGFKSLTDGRRQILAFHLPGDIFGVENGGIHRFSTEAVVETTICQTNRRNILDKEGFNATALTNVRKLVTQNLEQAEIHLLLLGRKTAIEKVAAFLLEMDIRLAAPPVLFLPMSRNDIADYLGLTLESVSRAMSRFKHGHILSYSDLYPRQITLRNREKLADFDH
jgi:CRP/FNR family nitrogen fixation transcriptional regulator